MGNGKIVIVGSSNTDMVIKSERIPEPGETILGGTFLMNPGGKGANQAVAVSRLGGDVVFVAKTGNDLFGRQSVELYANEGINTDYIISDAKNPSGVAIIMVDAKGENCIAVASGANGTLSPKDVNGAKKEIENAEIVLMQLETPMDTVQHVAAMASKKGVKVILNPAPAAPLSDELLKCLYIITPNKSEAEMISGIKVTGWESARVAADAISAKGVGIVVITLGSLGALIKDGSTYYNVPAEKVTAVDTTAAGDVFNGALCVALAEGKEIHEAVKFASKASSIAVTRMGAQSSIPSRRELDQLIKSAK